MRYNEEIQALADQCAREDDLFCFAAYIGRCQDFHVMHGDIFVFSPMYEDSIPRSDGMPHYITVMDGEADYHSDFYTCEVYKYPIRRYNNAKGRQILRNYERMVIADSFTSDNKRSDVISIVDYSKSPLCDKSALYAYLAAAERLNMRLELFCDSNNSRRMYHDGVDDQELFFRLMKP